VNRIATGGSSAVQLGDAFLPKLQEWQQSRFSFGGAGENGATGAGHSLPTPLMG
jgi:hypothetical protein